MLVGKGVGSRANVKLCCVDRIKAKIDDDMLRYFCNEDTFIIRIERVDDGYQVLLTVDDAAESNVGSNDRPRSSLSSKSTASVPFLSQRSDDSTSSDH
jgi:hypothetical protein